MAENVSTDTLFEDTWNNLFDLLKDGLVDPDARVNPNGRSAVWIYAAFPTTEIDKKTAYPLVVINPVDVVTHEFTTIEEDAVTMVVDIEVYSTGKSKQVDSLCDSIFKIFRDNESTLRDCGMELFTLTRSSYMCTSKGPFKIHMKTLGVSFRYAF